MEKQITRDAWELVTLKELGQWSGGGTPSKAKPEYWTSGKIPWVSPKDMKMEHIIDSEDHITKVAIEESTAKLIPAGSILIVTRSGILSHTLPVAVTTVPVTVNQDLKALTPKDGVLPEYVAWALRCFAREILNTCSKQGTTVNSIETAALHRFEIPLAPLDQQKQIVAEIEKQFSRLDEAVANLKRVKANLKRYNAAVLKAAVEGRLVETEAELARREGRSYEAGEQLLQRILETRRSQWQGKGKYKEPAAPDTIDLPELPEGWMWSTVESICQQIVDCPHSTARFQNAGYPCIDTTWMTTEGLAVERARFVNQTAYQERIARLKPESGDIVFAREGTIGTAIVIPDRMEPCLGQRVMLLRASVYFSNKLLMHTLHSEVVKAQYRAQALGSTVPHINVGDVKLFAIPVPPLAEQERISAELDRRLSLVREVEAQADSNLKRAERLRQSILSDAFAGKLSIFDKTNSIANALVADMT